MACKECHRRGTPRILQAVSDGACSMHNSWVDLADQLPAGLDRSSAADAAAARRHAHHAP